MKKVFYSWDDIEKTMDKIFDQMKESRWLPEVIISIGEGGLVPARLLADRLKRKAIIDMISAKMYTGIGERNATPKIGPLARSYTGMNVLLIDDIIDSGLTIDAVIDKLKTQRCRGIKVATLDAKEHVKRLPSYWVNTVKKEEWIVYPWEKQEFKD